MQPRDKRLSLRLNAEEYSHLKRLAQTSGMKLEPTIRTLIMGENLRPRPPDEMADINRQMSGIGTNINQIARRMNESGRVYGTDLEQVIQNQEQLWNMANGILVKLAGIK